MSAAPAPSAPRTWRAAAVSGLLAANRGYSPPTLFSVFTFAAMLSLPIALHIWREFRNRPSLLVGGGLLLISLLSSTVDVLYMTGMLTTGGNGLLQRLAVPFSIIASIVHSICTPIVVYIAHDCISAEWTAITLLFALLSAFAFALSFFRDMACSVVLPTTPLSSHSPRIAVLVRCGLAVSLCFIASSPVIVGLLWLVVLLHVIFSAPYILQLTNSILTALSASTFGYFTAASVIRSTRGLVLAGSCASAVACAFCALLLVRAACRRDVKTAREFVSSFTSGEEKTLHRHKSVTELVEGISGGDDITVHTASCKRLVLPSSAYPVIEEIRGESAAAKRVRRRPCAVLGRGASDALHRGDVALAQLMLRAAVTATAPRGSVINELPPDLNALCRARVELVTLLLQIPSELSRGVVELSRLERTGKHVVSASALRSYAEQKLRSQSLGLNTTMDIQTIENAVSEARSLHQEALQASIRLWSLLSAPKANIRRAQTCAEELNQLVRRTDVAYCHVLDRMHYRRPEILTLYSMFQESVVNDPQKAAVLHDEAVQGHREAPKGSVTSSDFVSDAARSVLRMKNPKCGEVGALSVLLMASTLFCASCLLVIFTVCAPFVQNQSQVSDSVMRRAELGQKLTSSLVLTSFMHGNAVANEAGLPSMHSSHSFYHLLYPRDEDITKLLALTKEVTDLSGVVVDHEDLLLPTVSPTTPPTPSLLSLDFVSFVAHAERSLALYSSEVLQVFSGEIEFCDLLGGRRGHSASMATYTSTSYQLPLLLERHVAQSVLVETSSEMELVLLISGALCLILVTLCLFVGIFDMFRSFVLNVVSRGWTVIKFMPRCESTRVFERVCDAADSFNKVVASSYENTDDFSENEYSSTDSYTGTVDSVLKNAAGCSPRVQLSSEFTASASRLGSASVSRLQRPQMTRAERRARGRLLHRVHVLYSLAIMPMLVAFVTLGASTFIAKTDVVADASVMDGISVTRAQLLRRLGQIFDGATALSVSLALGRGEASHVDSTVFGSLSRLVTLPALSYADTELSQVLSRLHNAFAAVERVSAPWKHSLAAHAGFPEEVTNWLTSTDYNISVESWRSESSDVAADMGTPRPVWYSTPSEDAEKDSSALFTTLNNDGFTFFSVLQGLQEVAAACRGISDYLVGGIEQVFGSARERSSVISSLVVVVLGCGATWFFAQLAMLMLSRKLGFTIARKLVVLMVGGVVAVLVCGYFFLYSYWYADKITRSESFEYDAVSALSSLLAYIGSTPVFMYVQMFALSAGFVPGDFAPVVDDYILNLENIPTYVSFFGENAKQVVETTVALYNEQFCLLSGAIEVTLGRHDRELEALVSPPRTSCRQEYTERFSDVPALLSHVLTWSADHIDSLQDALAAAGAGLAEARRDSGVTLSGSASMIVAMSTACLLAIAFDGIPVTVILRLRQTGEAWIQSTKSKSARFARNSFVLSILSMVFVSVCVVFVTVRTARQQQEVVAAIGEVAVLPAVVEACRAAAVEYTARDVQYSPDAVIVFQELTNDLKSAISAYQNSEIRTNPAVFAYLRDTSLYVGDDKLAIDDFYSSHSVSGWALALKHSVESSLDAALTTTVVEFENFEFGSEGGINTIIALGTPIVRQTTAILEIYRAHTLSGSGEAVSLRVASVFAILVCVIAGLLAARIVRSRMLRECATIYSVLLSFSRVSLSANAEACEMLQRQL